MIPINLVFEDILSEAILKVMLQQSQRPFAIQKSFNCHGFGKIKKQILAYNNAAQNLLYQPVECGPLLSEFSQSNSP